MSNAVVAIALATTFMNVNAILAETARQQEETRVMNMQQLTEAAQSVQDFVVKVRRRIHMNPETRWEEDDTRKAINRAIYDMGHTGFDIFLPQTDIDGYSLDQPQESNGGLVFDYNGAGANAPRILFRADIDALPIHETTGLPFASQNEGLMHACGHDTHTAMLLGAMRVIGTGLVNPVVNLRFVFQQSEENPGTDPVPISGGDKLVQSGVLEGVSRAYGLHIWPSGDAGTFYSRSGALLGNSGRFKMVLHSTGGHVAEPHKGGNVLRIYHEIQSAFDTIKTRHLPPTEPSSIEPAIAKAGEASNVMPAAGEFWWGVRTMLQRDEHANFMSLMETEARSIVARYPGSSAEFSRIMGHPSLINDAMSYNGVSARLSEAGLIHAEHPPILGGEDFAHYLDQKNRGVPGSFWMLGAHQEGTGDCHQPNFNPNEDVFWKGVLYWLLLATSPELL